MKINKVISAVLSACLCLTCISPMTLAKFSDVEDSKAIDVVTGLGIMQGSIDGTFSPEANLTRAEFAQIVADIYTYGTEVDSTAEWKQNFFEGIFEAETEFIPPEEMNQTVSELYSDVQEGNEYYKAIELVTHNNIMNGVGNGEFSPDGNLTIEQTLKVMLTMMGYGTKVAGLGGYPKGYMTVASDLEILDNVGANSGEYVTKKDVANVIYNVLDIPLMQHKLVGSGWSYTTYEDETFLSKILDLGYDRGRMTANGYTTLSGADSVGKKYVTINNTKYEVNENTEYSRDFIGRDVEVYYPLSDDSEDFVYACLSNRDTVTEFDIADYVKYTKGKITYYEGAKEKNVSLVSVPYMIRNNSAVSSFDSTIFDFNYGTVEVIEPVKQSEADLIILKSYQNFNVDMMDRKSETIYSSTSALGTEIDLGDEDKEVVIYGEDGKETTIEALVNGTVTSVCYGDRKIEIYISTASKKNFTVKRMAKTERGEYSLNDGNETHIMSKDYTDKNPGSVPRLNAVYDLKFDIFGNIVSIKEVSGSVNVAFLNHVRKIQDEKTFEDEIMVKYYDIDQKLFNTTHIADKVEIIDTDGKVETYNLEDNVNEINSMLYNCIYDEAKKAVIGNIVRYTLDDEGEIDWIELPGVMDFEGNDSSRLVEIPGSTSEEDDNSNLYGAAGLWGGRVIIPNTAKVLQCNYKSASFEEASGYAVTNRSVFAEGKHPRLRVYSTVNNSPIAEYVVETKDPSAAISTDQPQTCGIVLADTYETWDETEGEQRSVLTLDTGEFMVEADALTAGNVKNVQGDSGYVDGKGNKHDFVVEKGDIIRYGLTAEGVIDSVQLLYDANADYSNGIKVQDTVYGGWSKLGNLAGVIDGYLEDDSVRKYSNPYSYNSIDGQFMKKAYDWSAYNGYMRVMAGSIVTAGNNYAITTTRNLTENPGDVEYNGDGKYATNIWDVSKATLVTVGRKNVSVQTIGNSEFKTYQAVGKACDRVIITSRLGRAFNFIIYRYE